MDEITARTRWDEATELLGDGRLKDAELVLRKLIADGAAGSDLLYLLGFALLAQGRYEEGFKLYEARSRIRSFGLALPPFPFPRWRGEPIIGKRLLVWSEQGFGDAIMFSRFGLPLAERRVDVTFAVQPALARLFQGTAVKVLPIEGAVTLPVVDLIVALGDLPLCSGVTLETLPPPWPVRASARGIAAGIGVVTRGEPKHANDQHRSLPPNAAAELLGLPGAVDLHRDQTGAQDFQETADIIAGLDLVISVDTAVAHLAASLGKPTWILLPHHRTDWRWMRDRTDSPWYPSVRLFRQTRAGYWDDVLGAVRNALAKVRGT